MGKKSFHFSQNQPRLGLYAQWWISVYLHRPASLLCRKRVILSTRWFSRIEKQLLLLPAYEMLPCLSYLLLEAAALLSRPKPNGLLFIFSSQTSFSSFDRIFRFQYVTSVSKNFFVYSHLEISADTRGQFQVPSRVEDSLLFLPDTVQYPAGGCHWTQSKILMV